jgi:4-alpha-glucanotransferase
VKGPGADFFEAAQREFGSLPFIAEDLGMITPDVPALRDRYELPGMRVLQFGFDGDPNNPHLPHNYTHSAVAYTGTHDNNTTRGWFEALPDNEKQIVQGYLRQRPSTAELMRVVWSSPAALSIAPLQDLLDLGAEARMNVPGRTEGNWRWRCTEKMLSRAPFDRLHELTNVCGRLSARAAELTLS